MGDRLPRYRDENLENFNDVKVFFAILFLCFGIFGAYATWEGAYYFAATSSSPPSDLISDHCFAIFTAVIEAMNQGKLPFSSDVAALFEKHNFGQNLIIIKRLVMIITTLNPR